tara:strand:- start:445 stop:675 length:231 start_codon:yes stop_codon:yes gene_type:complete
MPKKEETTYKDIDYAIRDIYEILCRIEINECKDIVERALEGRARENNLDVDISESEDEYEDDTISSSSSESESEEE